MPKWVIVRGKPIDCKKKETTEKRQLEVKRQKGFSGTLILNVLTIYGVSPVIQEYGKKPMVLETTFGCRSADT